jgi:hypothetical protein
MFQSQLYQGPLKKNLGLIFLGIFTFTLGFFFSQSHLSATEVDNITPRLTHPHQKDALEELNRITNEYLQQCLDSVNSAQNYAGAEKLPTLQIYNICHGILGSRGPWAKFEVFLNQTDQIETVFLSKSESIYKYFNFFDSFALKMAHLGNTMRIGQFDIGTDKVGHFIDQGYQYFTKNYVQKEGMMSAFIGGHFQEKTYYGEMSTGIFSYGDMNANFRGMTFWAELFKNEFNSELNFTPYFIFNEQNHQWELNPNRTFNWITYFDAAVDEGINCSSYRNEGIQKKIDFRLQELSEQYGQVVKCPMIESECKNLGLKIQRDYPEYVEFLVTPVCRG